MSDGQFNVQQRDPCLPSPCGLFSQCINVGGTATCACFDRYIGSPPNCRPECSINSECPSNQACINERCRDPCPGACGINAVCNVFNHIAQCTCIDQYTGDPFLQCHFKTEGKIFISKKVVLQLISYTFFPSTYYVYRQSQLLISDIMLSIALGGYIDLLIVGRPDFLYFI